MFVIYHDHVCKVHDFKTDKDNSVWLDIGVGYWVRSDNVDILINRSGII